LAEPLLAGVYGGDPVNERQQRAWRALPKSKPIRQLDARACWAQPRPKSSGSLFRTLKGGLGQLVDCAAAQRGRGLRPVAEALERVGSSYRRAGQMAIGWKRSTSFSRRCRRKLCPAAAADPFRARRSSRCDSLYFFHHPVARVPEGDLRSSAEWFRIFWFPSARENSWLHAPGWQQV